MKGFKPGLRTQFILLLSLSLMTAGSVFLYVTTRIMTQDKTAYVYDFILLQAQQIATEYNDLIRPVAQVLVHARETDNREVRLDLEILKKHFSLEKEELPRGTPAPARMELSSGLEPGKLEFKLFLSNGRSFRIYPSEFQLQSEFLGKTTNLCLIHLPKKWVLTRIEQKSARTESLCSELAGKFQSEFDRGTREFDGSDQSYLLAYQRLGTRDDFLVLLVPKSVVAAAPLLLLKTVLGWGSLILLISLVLSVWILRAVTARIERLVDATEQISSGRLDVQLSPDQRNDEISKLSNSFGLMITRIKALLTETEEKARMENELLAAQSVQKQFFPDTNPVLPALELQCATVPASECGGDLFYFHHFEKQVCFVFGDVTGHGLPAALSTAYIYGCLNTALGKMSQLSPEAGAAMFLNHLTQDLQSLMTSLRGDSAWLSALIGHLDLSTGKLTLKFHAHPSAFVLKADGAGLTTLSGVPSHPIGFEADPIEDVVEITLQADDQLILLSDGIYEKSFTSGLSPTKKDWKKWLTHLPTDHSAASTLAAIRAKVSGDFGEKLADDITLVCLKYQPGSLTPVHPESPELKSKREGSV